MIDYEALFRAERAKVEELEETIRQLLAGDIVPSPKPTIPPSRWPVRMTSAEQSVVMELLKANQDRVATNEQLYLAISASDRAYGGDVDEFERRNKAKVYIHKVRKKLRPLDIAIITVWGRGYYIPADGIEAWHAIVGGLRPLN